jgi:phosphoglycolate phosphatase-like HAD superfamily hydrolase
MKFSGVIFDFDGTLADTLPLCVEAFRRAAEPLVGRSLTDEEIIATFGPSEEGNVRQLAPESPEECLRSYLKHYESLHDQYSEPFEGVRRLLDRLLDCGARLALVTGKGPRTAAMSLDRMRLRGIFDPIETGWEHGVRKREAILDVLRAWSLDPSRVVYVGDAPSDVRASREAGVAVVGVAYGSFSQLERLALEAPDALFTSVEDLSTWLLSD